MRNVDSLRSTFKHLASSRKPTAHPSCTDSVRRTKQIAEAILRKGNAACVGLNVDRGDREMMKVVLKRKTLRTKGSLMSNEDDDELITYNG